MSTTCEMVLSHHPDCECAFCRAMQDPVCGKPVIGALHQPGGLLYICADCAKLAEDDPEAYGTLVYNNAKEDKPRT